MTRFNRSERFVLKRLRAERPDLYAAVLAGELSLPKAMVEAWACACCG